MTDKQQESKNAVKTVVGTKTLKCALCGVKLKPEAALLHKNEAGEREVICHACFEKETGVDYETFAYRRESAKQVFFATVFCLVATIYAFVSEGWQYGLAGLVMTVLIFLYGGKVK